MPVRATQRHGCDVMSMKVKHRRKAANKTPNDIIGAENVTALKQEGFVVVRLSGLAPVSWRGDVLGLGYLI
jgi:hypothetical protein